MSEKPTYEELEQRVRELEQAESNRIQAELRLKESEKFLKDVLKASSVGISYTRDRKIVWANEAMEQLFGFENEAEYIGKDTSELYARREDYDQIGSVLFEQNKEKKIQQYYTTFERKDGTLFEGAVQVNLIDVDDAQRGVITSIVDITARKRTEEKLRKSEEKYRILVENAIDAIFIVQDGRIRYSNKRTSDLIGHAEDYLTSVPFNNFIHPEDREMVADRHARRLRGEPNLPSTYSFRIIRNDGAERLVQISTTVYEWENRKASLNFVRDITEQRKLELTLYQAQKLEALGTLAGGIAHDFNNLLMGIQGRISILGLTLGESGPHLEHIKAIEDHVVSATALTKQLLGFACGGKYDVKPVDINDQLMTTAKMFGRTHKEISIHLPQNPSPLIIEADQGQIEQLLLNLLINAWQAMPDGGDIFIESEWVNIDDNEGRGIQLEPGGYCKIAVTDTGTGMEKDIIPRIFDPFFTTKKKGRGTGLGLASAFGITKNHGGTITVSSELGQGSTFTLYFPLCDKEAAQEKFADEGVVYGSATILFVDDEKDVIEVGKAMLEILGYDVITAIGGKEALKAVRENGERLDLVILDMIMPEVDGGKVFNGIHEINPQLPVLLSSGYSIDGKAEGILEKGCRGFIQKPFSIEELSRKIREILDR